MAEWGHNQPMSFWLFGNKQRQPRAFYLCTQRDNEVCKVFVGRLFVVVMVLLLLLLLLSLTVLRSSLVQFNDNAEHPVWFSLQSLGNTCGKNSIPYALLGRFRNITNRIWQFISLTITFLFVFLLFPVVLKLFLNCLFD